MRLYPVVFAVTLAATTAAAAAADLIDKASPHDVATTTDRLEKAIKDAGGGVVQRVDHSGIAEGADMKLRPTQVVIFGSAEMGSRLMQESQAVGLVLPLRVAVYEDEDGDVHVIYEDMNALTEGFGVPSGSGAAAEANTMLDTVTTNAIAE